MGGFEAGRSVMVYFAHVIVFARLPRTSLDGLTEVNTRLTVFIELLVGNDTNRRVVSL